MNMTCQQKTAKEQRTIIAKLSKLWRREAFLDVMRCAQQTYTAGI